MWNQPGPPQLFESDPFVRLTCLHRSTAMANPVATFKTSEGHELTGAEIFRSCQCPTHGCIYRRNISFAP